MAVNLICGYGWKPWLEVGGQAGGQADRAPACVCLGFFGLAQALLLFWEPRLPLRGLEPPEEKVVSRGRLGGPLASHVFNWPQL